jgi:hypothetical protein
VREKRGWLGGGLFLRHHLSSVVGWGSLIKKGTTEPHAKFGLLNEEYKNMTKVAEERHDERAVNVPFSFLVETSLLGARSTS